MYVTPTCWASWEPYFREKGYRTLAPAWPEHDPPAATQRSRHPNLALGKLTLADLLSHYRGIIKGLDEKPILIGHSMGGLIVQLLLQEGLATAAVAIDSAPPKGVISLKWSFLKSNWPAINPFASSTQPVMLDHDQFEYAFTNTLGREASLKAYEAESVPESRQVGKGPTTAAAAIDFSRPHPPLLMISGEMDHIIPAALNQKNFERYKKGNADSITEHKVFPGRDHWIIASEGWKEVADHVYSFIGPPKQ
jgi:pimeloyl-ACP methyl ester carboxylesterase